MQVAGSQEQVLVYFVTDNQYILQLKFSKLFNESPGFV